MRENRTLATPEERAVVAPVLSLREESFALYAALAAGALGAVIGVVVGLTLPPLPLFDEWSFADIAAIVAGLVAAVAGSIGYWRSRRLRGQEWRLHLSAVTFSINAVAVVLVHVVLAVLTVLAVFVVLSRGLVGALVEPFWATVLMAVSSGLVAYRTYLSVSRMTTQRMSSLLMAFVVIGTLTAMVTTTDPDWWKIHFSHLGTFWSISSLMFNGTLIAGGLLVTAFAVSLAHDMQVLADTGALTRQNSPRVISTMFVIMGVMLAGVGIVPVNISLWVHNICASGMAVMFIGMLVGGPWIVRGMPRAYFIASWLFLAATVVTTVLFVTGYFGLTALEIIVFALIFGWISVFIRFLGVAGQRDGTRGAAAV